MKTLLRPRKKQRNAFRKPARPRAIPTAHRAKRFTDYELLRDDPRGTLRRFVRKNAIGDTFWDRIWGLYIGASKIPSSQQSLETNKRAWANRPATEIIASNNAFVSDRPIQAGHGLIGGCVDRTIVLLAAMRTLARMEKEPLAAKFVRSGEHSYVRTDYRGQSFFFDPNISTGTHAVSEEEERWIERAAKEGTYAQGFGPRSIGIRTTTHFGKYAAKKGKNGPK